jgi:hypothetical protein
MLYTTERVKLHSITSSEESVALLTSNPPIHPLSRLNRPASRDFLPEKRAGTARWSLATKEHISRDITRFLLPALQNACKQTPLCTWRLENQTHHHPHKEKTSDSTPVSSRSPLPLEGLLQAGNFLTKE